jgi:hypothetical protein
MSKHLFSPHTKSAELTQVKVCGRRLVENVVTVEVSAAGLRPQEAFIAELAEDAEKKRRTYE